MNINQLKYFFAVCASQTVSDAAKRLHISQPSLSSAIKELENEFGVTLFKRHHRGMTLTPEGEVLFKMSKDILNRAEETKNVMKDLGSERKKLKLGVPPMIGSIILPSVFRDFVIKEDNVILDIVEGGSHELINKLFDDYLDMVFVTHSHALDSSLSSLQVARLEITCCASLNNPIMKHNTVSPQDLSNTPLILFENSFLQTEEIKKWFAKDGIKPNILMQTEQLSTMLSIISNNIAVGFMFKQLTTNNKEISSIPMESPIYVDISLVWKKDAYSVSSMQKFKEYINNNNLFHINKKEF
ncbi:MAG: LysR family transcriptional regulator [Ruminococcaceae bacterium]|nr:LysR family transcriptional regulator [Oscillospiraceae bacterium]